jgi:hypothetical protein
MKMPPTFLRHWIWSVPLFCIGCFSIPFTRSKPIEALVESDFALLPQPPEVDYANETSWAALPWRKDMADSLPRADLSDAQANANVDVFFIHPTIYTGSPAEKKYYWNADVNDSIMNASVDGSSILFQSTVFNGSCRVFAPRYRQAHISAFYTRDRSSGEAALELAYRDVKKAFCHYLEYYNNGRPFIIAGHSQGTRHGGKLLHDVIEPDAQLLKRLVASYLVGLPVPPDYFSSLPLCDDPEDINCFVSWCTFQKGYYPPNFQSSGYNNALCVNPLSWKADTLLVPREDNLGGIAWKFNKVIPNINDARVHMGMLWIQEPRVPGRMFINLKNYHVGDYNLFWFNIRENVKQRCDAYVKQQVKLLIPLEHTE